MYIKLKNNKGFTIIEVLIVLAIAALILLIVFLAVPALQRSAHNTSRKNDASAVLSAADEFAGNNNGTEPNEFCYSSPNLTLSNSTTGGTYTPANAKMGYYTTVSGATGTPPAATGNGACATAGTNAAGNLEFSLLAGSQTYSGSSTADYLMLDTGAVCEGGTSKGNGSAAPTYKTVAGTSSNLAILYEIETGSNSYSVVCTDN